MWAHLFILVYQQYKKILYKSKSMYKSIIIYKKTDNIYKWNILLL